MTILNLNKVPLDFLCFAVVVAVVVAAAADAVDLEQPFVSSISLRLRDGFVTG